MRKIPSLDDIQIDLDGKNTVEIDCDAEEHDNDKVNIVKNSEKPGRTEKRDGLPEQRDYRRLRLLLAAFMAFSLLFLLYYSVNTYLPKIIELIETGAIS